MQHYNTGVEICRLAKSFSTNCQNHLIQQLARHAPDADTQSDWHTIFTAHRAIQTTWGWRTNLYNVDCSIVFGQKPSVSLMPVRIRLWEIHSMLFLEYHCHIYSAAAWRLFQIEEPAKRTLEEWRTEQRIGCRTGRPSQSNRFTENFERHPICGLYLKS